MKRPSVPVSLATDNGLTANAGSAAGKPTARPARAVWDILQTDANLPLMAQTLNISEVTARVMANRGLRSKKTAQAFLNAAGGELRDPFLCRDMDRAVSLLANAVQAREPVLVYGDYDADGVCATAILIKALKRCGAAADYQIPLRAEEGYGLNIQAVRDIARAGYKWIVTVDNGVSALEEIAEAKRLGLRVVVVDHHEPWRTLDSALNPAESKTCPPGFTETDGVRRDVLPDADAVVDPKRADCAYPFKMLCGAGLAFLLARALCERCGVHLAEHDELLALAALATVCDLVDLREENRVLVRRGLDILNANKLINPGLGSLIARRGYLDKPIDTFAAGFVLGPCINATGRLDSAGLSARLLLASADDTQERLELAERLYALNEERKDLTVAGYERVLAAVPADPPKVLVLTDDETHESVAGIVAGRVKERWHRPVFVLTPGGANGDPSGSAGLPAVYGGGLPAVYKGSGRSVDGYNMFEALYANRHLLLRFGGHEMAAGLTVKQEHIETLRDNLNAACKLSEADFLPKFAADAEIAPEDATLALVKELSLLAPFGKGNHEPLFVSRGLTVESLRVIDGKNTLIFTFLLNGGKRLKGICFGLNGHLQAQAYDLGAEKRASVLAGMWRQAGVTLDALFTVEANEYNGNTSVQLRLRDFYLR